MPGCFIQTGMNMCPACASNCATSAQGTCGAASPEAAGTRSACELQAEAATAAEVLSCQSCCAEQGAKSAALFQGNAGDAPACPSGELPTA